MTEITASNDKILVVMDGQCGLCSSGARWIARHDRQDQFQIVPMHSALGRDLFAKHGIDPDDPSSWLYLEDGGALNGFEGWARVGQVIGGSARVLVLLLLIPRPMRKWLYGLMARNRMAIWGRDDLCNLPDPDVARRLVYDIQNAEVRR